MRWRNNFPAIRLWLVFPFVPIRRKRKISGCVILCLPINGLLVAVSEQRLAPYQPFFAKFVPESPAIYLFFTPGKMMLQIQRAVAHASAVVLGHSYSSDVQRQVADVLFAKALQTDSCRQVWETVPNGSRSDYYP